MTAPPAGPEPRYPPTPAQPRKEHRHDRHHRLDLIAAPAYRRKDDLR